MKPKRHNPVAAGFSEGVPIIRKRRTAEQLLIQGQSVTDMCRSLVSAPLPITYQRWQQLNVNKNTTEARRPKELEQETATQKAEQCPESFRTD